MFEKKTIKGRDFRHLITNILATKLKQPKM